MAVERARVALLFALVAPVAPRACDSAVVRHETAPAPECEDAARVYGQCVGVPNDGPCTGDGCDAACSRASPVTNDAELAEALAAAEPGSCIALADGDYDQIELPPGVSLSGGGAERVQVRGISVSGGEGASLRGLGVGAAGIAVRGATGVRIHAVRVEGSDGDGISIEDGASVAITRSEVLSAGHIGVSSDGTADISLATSRVADAQSGGIWITCAESCDCPGGAGVDLDTVLVSQNRLVGVSAAGARVSARRLVISGTQPDQGFENGFGLVASDCADLDLRQSTLESCSAQGIFIDRASARIGDAALEETVELRDVGGGVWVQHVSSAEAQEVRVERVRISRSRGVGLGISGHSSAVFVRDLVIADTQPVSLPTAGPGGLGAGSVEVGDGLVWLDRSFADISGVTIVSSPRASFLIDGEVAAGSRIADVTFSGGDAGEPIVQQRCPSWGSAPALGDELPPMERTEEEVFPVPWQ